MDKKLESFVEAFLNYARYDSATGFTSPESGHGWTFGVKDSIDSKKLEPFDSSLLVSNVDGTLGISGWEEQTENRQPSIHGNLTNGPIDLPSIGGYDLRPDQLHIHPEQVGYNEYLAFRYVPEVAGEYSFSMDAQAANSGGVELFAYKYSKASRFPFSLGKIDTIIDRGVNTLAFKVGLDPSKGDYLEVVLDPAGDYSADSTAVSMNLFTVTESGATTPGFEEVVVPPVDTTPKPPVTPTEPTNPTTPTTPVTPTEPTTPTTPLTPASAPRLLRSNVDGDIITLQFDTRLNPTVPFPSAFSILSNNRKVDVKEIEVNGLQGIVSIQLARQVSPSEKVVVDYLHLGESDRGVIESESGVDSDSFTITPLNQSAQINSLEIVDSEFDGNTLTLNLSESLKSGIQVNSRYFKAKAGRKKILIDSVTASQNGIIDIAFKGDASAYDSLKISYLPPKDDQITGVIEDSYGNDMKKFKNYEVFNSSSADEGPVPLSASVKKGSVYIKFDSILEGGKGIPGEYFELRAGGRNVPVGDVVAKKAFAIVPIESEQKFKFGTDLRVSYFDPKGDQLDEVLQNKFGNDVSSFSGLIVDI